MGVGVHALDGIGSQRTQRRQRGCNTQTDEAQVALGKDGSRDLQGGGNDQGTNAVGEQMLFNDTAAGSAQCAGSGNVLALLQDQDLAADDTRHAYPVQQSKDDEDGDHVGAKGLHPLEAGLGSQCIQRIFQGHAQQDDQQNIGDGVQNICNTHHDIIHPAAGKGRNRTIGGADDQHQHRSDQTDGQADAGAHHDTHSKVTTHTVGAQNVREHFFACVDTRLLGSRVLKGLQVVAAFHLLGIAVRPDSGQQVGKDGNGNDEHKADHGDLVLLQAADTVLPEVDAFAHDHQTLLFLIAGGQKILRV